MSRACIHIWSFTATICSFLALSGARADDIPASPLSHFNRQEIYLHIRDVANRIYRRQQALHVDAKLQEVAETYAQQLAELAAPPPDDASGSFRFLLNQHGIYDSQVRAVAVALNHPEELWTLLEPLLVKHLGGQSFTHVGVGLGYARKSSNQVWLSVALARRLASIREHKITADGMIRICGDVYVGARPTIWLTTPQGKTVSHRPAPTASIPFAFCASFPPDGPGTYRVELIVDGAHGPEVAVLFPLYLGVAAPRRPTNALFPRNAVFDPVEAEQHLMNLVNDERRKAGLKTLAIWPPLVRAAQAHSEDMKNQGFFGHQSPTEGGTEARLNKWHIPFERAGENVALAAGPAKAHQALMDSPSHRQAILEGEFTHLGIGVVQNAEGLVYVTEMFIKISK